MAMTDAEVLAAWNNKGDANAQQITDYMQQHGVDVGQLGRVTGQSGQSLIQQANAGGVTNQQLAQKNIIAPMDIGTTGNNLANAFNAGQVRSGVLSAYNQGVMGQSDPNAAPYTAEDMAEAQKYQREGYWGPTGTGDALTELRNAGITTGASNVNVPWAGKSAAEMSQSFYHAGQNSPAGQSAVGSGAGFMSRSGMIGFDPSTDTTRGQVDSMLQQDSEYRQQARTKALNDMNSRGLLNSSIAETAALSADINAVTGIADATANQYQKAKLTTQELNNRMDIAGLDIASREKIANLNASISNQSNTLGNYRAIAQSTNDMINNILTSASLTPEAKQTAIDNVLMYHDQYISFQDGITGLDLSSLITYA